MTEIWWLILLAGALTYLTRASGYLVVAMIGEVPPRLEAALNAVPAAVLTTIVTPALISGGLPEKIAIFGCLIMSFRLPLIVTVMIGTGFVALARAAGL